MDLITGDKQHLRLIEWEITAIIYVHPHNLWQEQQKHIPSLTIHSFTILMIKGQGTGVYMPQYLLKWSRNIGEDATFHANLLGLNFFIKLVIYILNRNVMMTSSNGKFSALLTLCAGNSPVTGEFPSQKPVTRSFHVFFDLHLSKLLSKQSSNCKYIYIRATIKQESLLLEIL